VDVEGDHAALFAPIEDQQLAVHWDRRRFGEFDLDLGRAASDQSRLADGFGRLGVAGLQLAGLASRVALDLHRAVLVGFEEEFLQRRRVGAVDRLDLAGDVQGDRRERSSSGGRSA